MWSLRSSETSLAVEAAAETSCLLGNPQISHKNVHLPKQHPLKDNDCDDDFCKAVAAPRHKKVVANMSEQFFHGDRPV